MPHAIQHLAIIFAETKQIFQLDCKTERAVGIGFLNDVYHPSVSRKLFPSAVKKGFTTNWTEELFIVSAVKLTKGESIKGAFCQQELQKANQEVYRGVTGRKKHL